MNRTSTSALFVLIVASCFGGCTCNNRSLLVNSPPDASTMRDMVTAADITLPPDLAQDCSGSLGICAINGHLEELGGDIICSTDPGGSESPASTEVCNDLDDDCNGFTDENCPGTCNVLPICLVYVGSRPGDNRLHWDAQFEVMVAYIYCADDAGGSATFPLSGGMTGDVTVGFSDKGVYRCQMHGSSGIIRLHSNIVILKN